VKEERSDCSIGHRRMDSFSVLIRRGVGFARGGRKGVYRIVGTNLLLGTIGAEGEKKSLSVNSQKGGEETTKKKQPL